MFNVVVAASVLQAAVPRRRPIEWSLPLHWLRFASSREPRKLPLPDAWLFCLRRSLQARSVETTATSLRLPSLNRQHPSPDLSRILSPAGVSAFLVPPLIPYTKPADSHLEPAALQLSSGCDPLPTPPLHARHYTSTMSKGVQQDSLIFDDDEEETCPLCVEEFDLTDKGFKPCPCGYQVGPRAAHCVPMRQY
jgi:hypothetical protein